MNVPVCFTHYFVNKQNIRSFVNVLPSNLLKNENEKSFHNHVFEDHNLTNLVSGDIFHVLNILKDKLKEKSKNDFKSYFKNLKETNGFQNICLTPQDKEEILNCCMKALQEIIPSNLLGSNHNKRIFHKMVRLIFYSMNRQHFNFSSLCTNWDFSATLWKSVNVSNTQIILEKIIFWICKYVLSSIIALNFYVTTCKLDNDEHKLYFFKKNEWQCFYDSNVYKMAYAKVIENFEPYSLGKNIRCCKSYSEKKRIRGVLRDIPKLHLVLKSKNNFRPIVRYKSDQDCPREKLKFRSRLNFIRELNGNETVKIETQFLKIYNQWRNNMKPQLYFVKTDLSNAFGSINRATLIKILNEKYCNLQKNENNLHVKKRYAQFYKDLVTEIRKPLLIRAGSTVYEWKKGLVQGYKYSPALSELYYSYFDAEYFSQFMDKNNDQIMFFIRVVDDYLFITDEKDNAQDFLKALTNYRNVNYDKTVVNFQNDDIQFSDKITFLGYEYNTITMEVSRASNVWAGQMCYKIAFSIAICNISKFLENRIGQSSMPINSLIFNLYHDNEELLWKHIFTTYCLSANKFCTILALLCKQDEIQNYMSLYKKRVAVKLSNSIIETISRNTPTDVNFMYCINHFRYLSFKALLLCARKTPKCNDLVPLINVEISKCNCLFGKWREHSSRIDVNGEMKQLANRDVCRRTDLRMLFINMDSLPNGFQCYSNKHKSIL